jgi:hypothetical protein
LWNCKLPLHIREDNYTYSSEPHRQGVIGCSNLAHLDLDCTAPRNRVSNALVNQRMEGIYQVRIQRRMVPPTSLA